MREDGKQYSDFYLRQLVVTGLFSYRNGSVSTENDMNTIWTFVDGHLVATAEDGTRLVTWCSPPSLALIVDLLNACPVLSAASSRAGQASCNPIWSRR